MNRRRIVETNSFLWQFCPLNPLVPTSPVTWRGAWRLGPKCSVVPVGDGTCLGFEIFQTTVFMWLCCRHWEAGARNVWVASPGRVWHYAQTFAPSHSRSLVPDLKELTGHGFNLFMSNFRRWSWTWGTHTLWYTQRHLRKYAKTSCRVYEI
jgi:hypothetical protein